MTKFKKTRGEEFRIYETFSKKFFFIKMTKYDYNNVVVPVFIEKVGGILAAHGQNYNIVL